MRYFLLSIAVLLLLTGTSSAQSLKGSKKVVKTAYEKAIALNFTFLNSKVELKRFIKLGLLVKLAGDSHYVVSSQVSHPYVRPELKLFVERLARQYRAACGERLVVTSATRLVSERPRNGSKKSVHPTGMAVDFRKPKGVCLKWLRATLLIVEKRKVTEATEEKRPPHFHVVIFPKRYACYVKRRQGQKCLAKSTSGSQQAVTTSLWPRPRPITRSPRPAHRVKKIIRPKPRGAPP